MIKLNDNSIFVGQIKQVLKDFNLPNCRVLDKISKDYDDFYIYKNYIYKRNNQKTLYDWNKKILNLTTNLRLDNLIYDRYTHRYLGRYLTFLRDYTGVDLFTLYNCFDQEQLSEPIIDRRIVIDNNVEKTVTEVLINNKDINYSCYQIPVNIEKYTVFTDCSIPATYCLNVEGDADINKEVILPKATLKKAALYPNKLIDVGALLENIDENIYKNKTIYLVLQLPRSYEGSVSVLCGDYSRPIEEPISMQSDLDSGMWFNSKLTTYANDQNYLLSDKMIQYLTGNVITVNSEDYDIIKYQKFMITKGLIKPTHIGYWTPQDTAELKKYIIKHNLQKEADVLPYVDSDVERSFNSIDGGLV